MPIHDPHDQMLKSIKSTVKMAAELEDGTQKFKGLIWRKSQNRLFFKYYFYIGKAFSNRFQVWFSTTLVKITLLTATTSPA